MVEECERCGEWVRGSHYHCGTCDSSELTSMMGHYWRDADGTWRFHCAADRVGVVVTPMKPSRGGDGAWRGRTRVVDRFGERAHVEWQLRYSIDEGVALRPPNAPDELCMIANEDLGEGDWVWYDPIGLGVVRSRVPSGAWDVTVVD